MGSSLAIVIIVNVRLCRDAFKGRFKLERECVHTLVGLVRAHFCHGCVVACSLVNKVWIAFDCHYFVS